MTDLCASKLGPVARGGVGEPIAHDSAHLHFSGEAGYTDDLLELRGTLHAAFALSRHAHARILGVHKEALLERTGVVRVLTAADYSVSPRLSAPATPEAILFSVQELRSRARASRDQAARSAGVPS